MAIAKDTMGPDLAYRLNVIETQKQIKKLPPELAGAEERAARPTKSPILTLESPGGAPGTVTITLYLSSVTRKILMAENRVPVHQTCLDNI